MYPAAAVGQARQSIPVQQPRQQQSGLLKSSLDIVWSYSRSQAFYGSNLDCSPSFVSRYRRPGDDEDEDGEEDEDGRDGEDEDGESEEDEDSDEVDASIDDATQLTVGTASASGVNEHGLPSNAVEQPRRAKNTGRRSSRTRKASKADKRASQGSSLSSAATDEDVERGERRAGNNDDRFNSPSPSPRKPSGPAAGQRRLQYPQSRSLRSRSPHSPRYIPSGSSLGLIDERHNGEESGASGIALEGSSRTTHARQPSSDASLHEDDSLNHRRPFANERSPLLEKRTPLRLDVDEQALAAQGLYGTSPPDSAPFPTQSPHLKIRKRPSELRKRRKSSAASLSPQGTSTSGQTLFNAINVLVGIGILAQPLAFSQAGWVLGTILLLFCSALTNYTAKVLARALYDDPRLMTYADIGAKAFGAPARTFINLLFCLEISALCVALIILLGDSLSIIFPLRPVYFKLIGFAVIFPTLFLPLRYLSVASLIGIISVVTLTCTVLIDGATCHSQPGSLRHPMHTSVAPHWKVLPIAFGLIMSGFGGHAVFPSLARDMKNPRDFNKVCNLAFIVATGFYMLMGVVGYLMFGHTVSDEITRDLLHTPALPRRLNLVAVAMVAVTPVCKYAISSTPLEGTISWILGVEDPSLRATAKSDSDVKKDAGNYSGLSRPSYSTFSSEMDLDGDEEETPRARPAEVSGLSVRDGLNSRRSSTGRRRYSNDMDGAANQSAISIALSAISQPLADIKPRNKAYMRQAVKLCTSLLVLLVAIFLPAFDRVMGLLGAFSVFIICAIGPLAANLSLYRRTMSRFEVVCNWTLLLISIVMGAMGTVWVFLPKEKLAR